MSLMDEKSAPLAVWAQTLYLLNLLLLPGLAFLALLLLWWQRGGSATAVERMHLLQTVWVSFIGGLLIVLAVMLLLWWLGPNSPWTWLWVLLYFTLVHTSLILLGVAGLVKALDGKPFAFPVIGRWARQRAALD